MKAAVEKVDEDSGRPSKGSSNRQIFVHFELRKVDEVVVVDGNINTHIELLCSRCANPFSYSCNPRFSALFCKDPDMARGSSSEKRHS